MIILWLEQVLAGSIVAIAETVADSVLLPVFLAAVVVILGLGATWARSLTKDVESLREFKARAEEREKMREKADDAEAWAAIRHKEVMLILRRGLDLLENQALEDVAPARRIRGHDPNV